MHYNQPSRPLELQILTFLKQRMTLSPDVLRVYDNLRKGYEGELLFATLLREGLTSDCIVLYDLLHTSNDSVFQLDCTIIQQHDIWHLEVKFFEGDFLLRDGRFYSVASEKEIKNPLNQLDRSALLLKQWLDKAGYHFQVRSYVIFVNPAFTLYEAPLKTPIIHPTQIKRFISDMNAIPSKLARAHVELARKLFLEQTVERGFDRVPAYRLEGLHKGIYCLRCHRPLTGNRMHLVCGACGYREARASAVLRNVVEFNILFPDKLITTKAITDWCRIVDSRYTIKKILMQFLCPVGERRHRHFVFPG